MVTISINFFREVNYIEKAREEISQMGEENFGNLGEEQFYFFDKYADGVQKKIDEIDYASLPKLNDKTLDKCRQDIIKLFNDTSENDLFENPPKLLVDFFGIVRSIFGKQSDTLKILQQHFPTVLPKEKSLIDIVLYIVSIIHDSKQPLNALQFSISNFHDQRWHKNASEKSKAIRSLCICKPKKRGEFDKKNYTWLIMDHKKNVKVFEVKDEKLAKSKNIEVFSLKTGANEIQIISKQKDRSVYYPVDSECMSSWTDTAKVPFPCTIVSVPKYIPIVLTQALYDAIINDDLLVLRTVAHFSVTKVSDGMKLCEALLDIFSYAGKVHQMLVTLAGLEFESTSLRVTTVLRGNSHLTNMFKIFNKRFGRKYYDSFLKALIEYVKDKGNIGLKDPATADEKKARTMLFTVLKNIIRSGDKIPQQQRHLASILRSAMSIRFNNKVAVFNALSGFFCLRFITALMTNPSEFDKSFKINDETQSMVMVPFSQMLQMPLNLMLLHNRMERFSSWNDRISKHIIPPLMSFVYSIAEEPNNPEQIEYEPPSPEGLKASLDIILSIIGNNHTKFQERYNNLKVAEKDRWPVIGWNFGKFICEFFKNNIGD